MPLPNTLLDALRRLNIATIRAEYSGTDDSGCIDTITCQTCDEDDFPLPDTKIDYVLTEDNYDAKLTTYVKYSRTLQMTLHDAIEQFCYDALEEHHAGWEIDGGADGIFEFDIAAGTARLTHNACIVEYMTSEDEV